GLAVLFLVAWFGLPRCYYLCMGPDGLVVQYPFNKRFYTWDEVNNLRVVNKSVSDNAPLTNYIVFDLPADSPKRNSMKRFTNLMLGYDISILAMFEMDAEEVVGLLKIWKVQYGTAPE